MFVVSCGIIKKFFYPSPSSQTKDKEFTINRGKKLLDSFEIPDLPHIKNIKVRNSYEHIDKRIDNIVQENKAEKVVLYDLTKDDIKNEFVLKKFNPFNFTINMDYLNEEISIKECYEEICLIRNNANRAHEDFKNGD